MLIFFSSLPAGLSASCQVETAILGKACSKQKNELCVAVVCFFPNSKIRLFFLSEEMKNIMPLKVFWKINFCEVLYLCFCFEKLILLYWVEARKLI